MNKKFTISLCAMICLLWAPNLIAQSAREEAASIFYKKYADFSVIMPESYYAQDYDNYQREYTVKPKIVKKYYAKKVKKSISKSAESYSGTVVGSSANSFVFNPRTNLWTAYDRHGNVVKSGRASGGKKYCPDIKRACKTPIGTFRVYSKGGASCKSSKFPVGKGGAPMPYCMFFRGGYAIHGSNDVPARNASHGCIRVQPAAARWLSKFLGHGAKVVVKSY